MQAGELLQALRASKIRYELPKIHARPVCKTFLASNSPPPTRPSEAGAMRAMLCLLGLVAGDQPGISTMTSTLRCAAHSWNPVPLHEEARVACCCVSEGRPKRDLVHFSPSSIHRCFGMCRRETGSRRWPQTTRDGVHFRRWIARRPPPRQGPCTANPC